MSAATTLLQSTLAGMSGNVAKAYIEITDQRESSISVEAAVPAGGGSSLTSLAKAGANVLSSVVSALGLTLGEQKYFVVKFNPSSLHLSGYSGGHITRTSFTDKKTEVDMEDGDTRITMSVTLLFDKTDPADAFMADKINLSTTAVATNVAKVAMSLAGKSDYSVQPEVEAFTAALHNEETRKIAFCWGNMRYEGILERVSARYTMFNTVGHPTRAEVQLSMICVDDNLAADNLGMWAESYEKAFNYSSSSLVTASQKMSSFLNLKL